MFFGFAPEITEITIYFGNCQWNSWLHHFYALILFFVKALRQWRQIQEAKKRWNGNYGKNLKQWSDEAFNAGKEIEAMKHLMLHRIASSLLLPSIACDTHQLVTPHKLGLYSEATAIFFTEVAQKKLRTLLSSPIFLQRYHRKSCEPSWATPRNGYAPVVTPHKQSHG